MDDFIDELHEKLSTSEDLHGKASILLEFVNKNFLDVDNTNKKISNLFRLYDAYRTEEDEETKKTLCYTFLSALTSLSILRACWMSQIKDEKIRLRLNLLYMPFRIHDLHNDFEGLEVFMNTLTQLDIFKEII
jgi:hypothetical protein